MGRCSSRLLSLLAVLMCAGSYACAGSEAATDRAQGHGTALLTVTRGDLVARVLLTGELVAEDAELLVVPNANVWPVQIRWLAEDGIEVEAGEKVVEFDNSQLTSTLEQMRAQAIAAATQLYSLQAQAASEEAAAAFELEQRRAEVEKARLEAEVPAGVLAERTHQQRQLALHKAELTFAEAEAKLEAKRRSKQAEIEVEQIKLSRAEAKLTRSEKRLEVLNLTAARDGILILNSHPWEGRPLQLGDNVFPGWVVGRLPDLSTMMVSAQLYDVDDGRVAPGMQVVATLDAFPEIRFNGRIREIDQIANQASRKSLRRAFHTKIDLDRVDTERMRPGMSVKVLVEQRYDDVLLVPRVCLDVSAQGARALKSDRTWAPVALGACDAMACVLEDGLEESAALARVEIELVADRDEGSSE